MGTGASTALASGATALYRTAHPGASPAQVIAAMRATATTSAALPPAPLLNPAALFP